MFTKENIEEMFEKIKINSFSDYCTNSKVFVKDLKMVFYGTILLILKREELWKLKQILLQFREDIKKN